MNKMMTKASLLAIALIVLIPLGLKAQDEGFYPYSFARLNYVNGSVYIQRTADLGFEKGEINLALVQGDKIGTEIGQAEIHFGRRNYLRLDNNTKVEFAVLPTEGEERIKIHLTDGSVYFRVSQLALDKGIEIHTPDASFYVLEEGLYRFDVKPEGETQVFVREGSLEAAAEDGSVLVRDEETLTAADGRLLGDPEYGYARGDAFDDWNGGRDAQLSERSERQYLPSEMGEYEEELDQNGHWVYERPYGNVWVPNVSSLRRLAALLLRPLGLVSHHRLDLGLLRVLGLAGLSLRPLELALRTRLVLDPPKPLGSGLGPLVVGPRPHRLVPPDLVQPSRLPRRQPLLRPLRRPLFLRPQPSHDRSSAATISNRRTSAAASSAAPSSTASTGSSCGPSSPRSGRPWTTPGPRPSPPGGPWRTGPAAGTR